MQNAKTIDENIHKRQENDANKSTAIHNDAECKISSDVRH